MTLIRSLLLASALMAAAPAAAQSAVAQAIQAGQVGERYDGYLAVVTGGSPEVRRQVSAVNIQRRKLYIELSARRNVSPELVGMATACQLFSELAIGQAYELSDGVWRRRAAGESVTLPAYCR
jgi:uncharacterized protein YdbL (DUF1318 family)